MSAPKRYGIVETNSCSWVGLYRVGAGWSLGLETHNVLWAALSMPFCGAHLRSFLAGGESHAVLAERSVIGGGLRSTVTCPVCLSFDRERAVYLHLKARPHMLARGTKLLHVAPERNLEVWLRSLPEIDYVSADLDSPDVDLKLDLTDIALPDSTFDAIICNHVLEHIPDDAKAMSEMLRVLKPSGWAIIQTPISLSLS